MKKTIFAFLAFLQISVMAYAGEYTLQGAYVGGLAGVNFINVDPPKRYLRHQGFHDFKIQPGCNIGAFAGYKFCNCENPALNIRLEAEVSYRFNSFKSFKLHSEKIKLHGHTNSITYMANAFYDFDLDSKWTPYIGIGIGGMHINAKTKSLKVDKKTYDLKTKGNKDVFASQYIAGLAYRIAEGTDLACEYRYLLARENANENTVALTLKRYF